MDRRCVSSAGLVVPEPLATDPTDVAEVTETPDILAAGPQSVEILESSPTTVLTGAAAPADDEDEEAQTEEMLSNGTYTGPQRQKPRKD